MGAHLIDGEFQSDKYPTTPRGKVPLSVKDKTAQDLLWMYAQRRREVDAEFSDDLEAALKNAGFKPPTTDGTMHESEGCYTPSELHEQAKAVCDCDSESCGVMIRCEDHPEAPVFAKYLKNKHSIAFVCAECEAALPTVHLDEKAHAQ